jgi:hypothetical protein
VTWVWRPRRYNGGNRRLSRDIIEVRRRPHGTFLIVRRRYRPAFLRAWHREKGA